MKKLLSLQFWFLLGIGTLTLSSCLKDDGDNQWDNVADGGIMYFVNSYPDTQEEEGLLYRLDGNVIMENTAMGVREPWLAEYQQFSGPQLLYPGNRKLTITSSHGSQEILIDTTITIEAGNGYTSFIYGTEENPLFAMTQDRTIENLGNQNAGIRFLNLASGVDHVNLLIEGEEEPLYTDRPVETGESVVANQAFQAFQVQAGGDHTYRATDAAGDELAIRTGAVRLRPGYYYTIILIGKQDDSDTPLYIGVIQHH